MGVVLAVAGVACYLIVCLRKGKRPHFPEVIELAFAIAGVIGGVKILVLVTKLPEITLEDQVYLGVGGIGLIWVSVDFIRKRLF